MMKEFLDELSLYSYEHTCEVMEELVSVYQSFPNACKLRAALALFFLSVYGKEQGIMLRLAVLF